MSYAAPSPVAVNFALPSGYSSPGAQHVDFTLGDHGATPARRVVVSVGVRHRSARPSSREAPVSAWSRPAAQDRRLGIGYAFRLRRLGAVTRWAWGRTTPNDGIVSPGWASAALLQPETVRAPWRRPPVADRQAPSAWASSTPADTAHALSGWSRTFARDRASEYRYAPAMLPAVIIDPPASGGGPGYEPPAEDAVEFALAAGYVVPPGASVNITLLGSEGEVDPPPYVQRRTDPRPAPMSWGVLVIVDRGELLPWGRGAQLGPRDPPPIDLPSGGSNEPPPIPTAEQVYIIMNSVQVVTLPERVPVEVLSIDLEASVDAWCWTLRMELADPAQIALLKPTASGPRMVEVTINDYVWTAVIEGRDGSRAHAKEGGSGASVTGRSQTALLSDSYTARRTLASNEARTAQQLALAEINDRSLPFTIDWAGVDWVVPAGVFTYQDAAPIDVIASIVAARGGVLLSAPGDAQLLVRSRYPTSPWAWTPANADITLPIEWVVSESAQQQNKPLYDGVFVIGQQQGVMARVVRSGEAGETWASQIVDPLIVTADVALERGRNVLADRGMQDLVQVQIPLFPPGPITANATGLYLPLLLVNVDDPSDPYQALSIAVSVSVRRSGEGDDALEVWQNVSLERHLSDAN